MQKAAPDAIPFWDLHEPLAILLRQGHGRTRRTINELVGHTFNPVEFLRKRTLVRSIRTPAGTIEMRTLGDGQISAKLIFSKKIDFAQRDIVLRSMALPDTVLANCVGRCLSEVADVGEHFPARHATIIAARRVVRTTRLTIDVPRCDIRSEEIAPQAR